MNRIQKLRRVVPLAIGGMAEILLGTLRGPSGFERPVVVKRILPHLASHAAFVSMLLDEGRLAARINHPNVITVQELGREENELFLVMEYLQGEAVAGIARRSRARGQRLPPALCAHVIAEACSGLHAAHELRAADGTPQELVHRDVSPQNIFVTYDGQTGYPLHAGDVVRIRHSERMLELVKAPARNYFELLREKLKWGERGGRE